ncbi:MAG: patatin-like phospholipase family protein [Pseudobdellovibrionaceae bacterium]
MRGLITAHFMQKIEDVTGLHMSDMVDIFMGPSTGSILNAALNIPNPYDPQKPKFKARHMVRFYEREGIHIFPRDSFRAFRSMIHDFNNRTMQLEQLGNLLKHGHYEHASLGRSLRALYGRHTLSNSLKSLIIPVYNIDSTHHYPHQRVGSHAVWLKNIKLEDALARPPCPQVDIYDAVLASTAAPTYFPCHRFPVKAAPDAEESLITGIDGSMFDNPCVSYFGALKPHLPPDRDLILIVLGTGQTNTSIPRDMWNRYGALGVVDPKHNMPLINFFFYASETALLESFEDSFSSNLFVFNKSLVSGPYQHDFPSTDIDDASHENVRRMKNFFEMTLEENRPQFDRMCDLLVHNYEAKLKGPSPLEPQKPVRRNFFGPKTSGK